MTKTKPMLFNSEMVRAQLDGRKTQTRRIVKPQPNYYDSNIPGLTSGCHGWTWKGEKYLVMDCGHNGMQKAVALDCPYGQPGDLLWVREDYEIFQVYSGVAYGHYGSDDSLFGTKLTAAEYDKWHKRKKPYAKTPGRFMYRSLSRLTLKITDVRVERVHDISEEDAKAEGVDASDLVEMKDGSPCYSTPYQKLWTEINGIDNPAAWESNPWVWVIEFEVIKQNVDNVLKVAA